MSDHKPIIEDTDAEKKKAMAKFLGAQFEAYRDKHGWRTTANNWAKYLGVNNAALSTWMNASRLPTGTNKHKLAAKLGPTIYDILREPRMMPADPEFHEVAEMWFEANRSTQKKVKSILEQDSKEVKANRGKQEGPKAAAA